MFVIAHSRIGGYESSISFVYFPFFSHFMLPVPVAKYERKSSMLRDDWSKLH